MRTPRRLLAALPLVACLTATLASGPAAADAVRDGEWALAALQVPDAWATTRGEGVTVAVLDTGVDPNHADLSGQVTTGPDFIGGDAQPGDAYWGGHGTAMASAVAGHGHGAGDGAGVIGVAPAARILSVRVIWDANDPIRRLSSREQSAAGAKSGNPIAQGIRYAADNGAQVINMSLGESDVSSAYVTETDSAVRYAIGRGVVVVASDGNSAQSGNQAEFPAGYPGVIAVAATDRNGHRATFSTHTWTTSVAAPGVAVVGARAGGGYMVGDGTSPAAALVSGVCALIRSRYPSLTPAQIRDVLERTAAGGGVYSEELGWGMVQAAAALRLAATLAPGPESPLAAQARQRLFGDGRVPAVGLRAFDVRRAVISLALLPAGGLCLLGAVLLAVLRRRPRPE